MKQFKQKYKRSGGRSPPLRIKVKAWKLLTHENTTAHLSGQYQRTGKTRMGYLNQFNTRWMC
jgi:hypothetical protein